MTFTTNTKKPVDATDDPFNKKKLAEEAKKEQDKKKAEEKLQAKNKLQMEISNCERELSQLVSELRQKEAILLQKQKKKEEVERTVFRLGGKIKEDEGSASYLETEVTFNDGRVTASLADLEKARQEAERAETERQNLESEYQANLVLLRDLETKIQQLENELKQLMAESDRLKKELAKNEADINLKDSEGKKLAQKAKGLELGVSQVDGEKSKAVKDTQTKAKQIKDQKQQLFNAERLVEQLDRENVIALQAVTKLKQGKLSKEEEINSLKRQKEAVK